MFEKATKLKLRYDTVRGLITTEDLWDLSLTRGVVNLNDIAKGLSRKLKEAEEEDFVETSRPNPELAALQLKFEIVKHVIGVKKAEQEEAAAARVKHEQKQKILEIMARKQDQKLEGMELGELEELLGKL